MYNFESKRNFGKIPKKTHASFDGEWLKQRKVVQKFSPRLTKALVWIAPERSVEQLTEQLHFDSSVIFSNP